LDVTERSGVVRDGRASSVGKRIRVWANALRGWCGARDVQLINMKKISTYFNFLLWAFSCVLNESFGGHIYYACGTTYSSSIWSVIFDYQVLGRWCGGAGGGFANLVAMVAARGMQLLVSVTPWRIINSQE